MKKVILSVAGLLTALFIGAVQAAPVFQAAGAAVANTGSVNVSWPVHAVGDVALLFAESRGNLAVSTPAGFALVPNSPQTTGDSNQTRITVFWARATSPGMPAATVTPEGDRIYAQIITYRGVISSGNPWDVTGGGIKTSGTNSVTLDIVTTTVPDTLIVQVVSHNIQSTAAAFSAQTNANLTGIAERSDGGTDQGQGGGFAVWDGVKATPGATGNTTATVTSSNNAFVTIALMPPPLVVAKSFSPATIGTGSTSTLTVTLTNSNTTAITGAAFTDTYPANLLNTATPGAATTCGGTVTAAANGTSLALSGGTVPASSSCTVTVSVTANVAGSYLNNTGPVTTTNAGTGTAATATLTVTAAPSLVFMKTVSITSDPVNLATNPKNIPGAEVLYTLRVTNTGPGTVDNNTVFVNDPIPANTELFVGDLGGAGSGPIVFVQGSPTTTLSWTYTALNNAADDVDFSNDNGSTWTYVPTPPYDTGVNRIRLKPKGTLAGASGGLNPYFELRFRVRVK